MTIESGVVQNLTLTVPHEVKSDNGHKNSSLKYCEALCKLNK